MPFGTRKCEKADINIKNKFMYIVALNKLTPVNNAKKIKIFYLKEELQHDS